MVRIGIIGPESTGKSSLARYLANRYKGTYVPEYARMYVERKGTTDVTFDELCEIAHRQIEEIEQIANSQQPIAFFDTELIVTKETNPHIISTKLINYFDIAKEGEDVESQVKRRKGQDYFRRMILANYGGRCALTKIDIPQLLLASHIIPWSDKSHTKERLNPCNGICLSALYDKAFDKGLIAFSPDDYTVLLSSALRENNTKEYFDRHFGCIVGSSLTLPTKYLPDRDFLAYHRDHVFMGE